MDRCEFVNHGGIQCTNEAEVIATNIGDKPSVKLCSECFFGYKDAGVEFREADVGVTKAPCAKCGEMFDETTMMQLAPIYGPGLAGKLSCVPCKRQMDYGEPEETRDMTEPIITSLEIHRKRPFYVDTGEYIEEGPWFLRGIMKGGGRTGGDRAFEYGFGENMSVELFCNQLEEMAVFLRADVAEMPVDKTEEDAT